ncbi:hypothetical protein [Vreelandella populi]|uniref:hypothetical protein n=1 Tax=Vreelandella populi TaxID=2498858 RepID=UPI000F8E0D87|nr:hypothetical protein [Halomonas populi]RUR38502.1 hypothetical protein ELY25_09060 [Halomonas populi]
MSAASQNEMERLRKAAEILVDKNDAANEKNRELMVMVERLTDERDAALEREQALAAHVERLKTNFMAGADDEQLGEIINGTPYASLARRDLIKQAEALEGFADEMPMLSSMGAKEALRLRAAELRKQAEGQ